MDALSDVLRLVGLTGGVFLDAEFTAPWSVSGKVAPELCRPFMVEPEYVIGFHYVVEGAFDAHARRSARLGVSAPASWSCCRATICTSLAAPAASPPSAWAC